jgi:hypothetical protein
MRCTGKVTGIRSALPGQVPADVWASRVIASKTHAGSLGRASRDVRQGAMASPPQRSRREIELALLERELSERRVYFARLIFELARDVVLLLVTVALAVVAIICALRGYPWPVPTSTGFAAVGFRALAEGHRGNP